MDLYDHLMILIMKFLNRALKNNGNICDCGEVCSRSSRHEQGIRKYIRVRVRPRAKPQKDYFIIQNIHRGALRPRAGAPPWPHHPASKDSSSKINETIWLHTRRGPRSRSPCFASFNVLYGSKGGFRILSNPLQISN